MSVNTSDRVIEQAARDVHHRDADRVLERAARGEADIGEIEQSISATRADLDRNLSAIEQQLSTDALISQAVTYLRSTPTEFLSNFGQAVKRNPVPTALLGVSIGWLMLSGRRASNGHGDRAYGGTEWDADVEAYEDREFYGDRHSYEARTGDIGDSEHPGVLHRASDAVRARGSAVAGGASHLADSASNLGHRVSSKFSQLGGKMSDANKHAHEVFQRARESVARARRTIAQQPRRVQATAHDMAEHHPFVLGALAFVAGAALAASLKRTRIEDETLGSYRDQALMEAENLARSELDRGMTSARTALESSDSDARGDSSESSAGAGSESTLPREQPAQGSSQDRFH